MVKLKNYKKLYKMRNGLINRVINAQKYYYLNRLRFVLICFVFLYSNLSYSQIQEPLPATFGSNQIQTVENLSSGVLNISLPIESHLIPIAISYSTGGVKQSQKAGAVGLGWNLIAGGYIQRQLRGKLDEDDDGYSGINKRGNQISLTPTGESFYNQSHDEEWDSHPDLFFFQFGGRSGFFAIDPDHNVVKLSQNNLLITPVFSGSVINSFAIKDESGNTFTFDVSEDSKSYARNDLKAEFTNKWHLSTIRSYLGDEDVTLTYMTVDDVSISSTVSTMAVKVSNNEKDVPTIDKFEYETDKKLLSSISYKDSRIELNYENTDNNDSGKRLSKVEYFLNNQSSVYYEFDYAYLADRLMLSGVRKNTVDVYLYQFLYYGQNDNATTLGGYGDPDVDHWGYKNANTAENKLPNTDRGSSFNKAVANALKRVYSTAGGFTEYIYEGNEYLEGSTVKSAGGLRIKKILKGDHHHTLYDVKEYEYLTPSGVCSGEIFKSPNYERKYDFESSTYYLYSDNSYDALFDQLGRHLNYQYVTVRTPDHGFTLTKFRTFAEDVTDFGTGEQHEFRKDRSFYIPGKYGDTYYHTKNYSSYDNSYGGPFGYNSFKGSGIGIPHWVRVYSESDQVISSVVYDYEVIQNGDVLLGMNTMSLKDDENDYHVSYYELQLGFLRLNQTTTTSYDIESTNRYLKTTTTNQYLEPYHLINYTKSYQGDNENDYVASETKYLIEEPGSLSSEISSSNLIGFVKSSTSYNNIKLGSSVNTYILSNGKVLLARTKNYSGVESSNNLISDISYGYHESGVVNEVVDNITTHTTSTILSQDGTKTLAKVSMSTNDESAFSSFELEVGKGGWSYPDITFSGSGVDVVTGYIGSYAYKLSSGAITKNLKANQYYILTYLSKNGTPTFSGLSSNNTLYTKSIGGWTLYRKKVMRTTGGNMIISGSAYIDHLLIYPEYTSASTYTYHPIFGVTSETDDHYNSAYYEYDEVGRVELIRDKNKDVVSTSEYEIPKYINSATSIDLLHIPSTKKLFVYSNDTYSISSNKGWLTTDESSGTGFGEFVVSATENTTTSQRSAIVTLTTTNGIYNKITITQDPQPTSDYLSASPITFNASSTTEQVISVYCDGTWVAEVAQQVGCSVTVDYTSSVNGTGNGSFTIRAYDTDHTSTGYSYGSVILRKTNGTKNILISANFDN